MHLILYPIILLIVSSVIGEFYLRSQARFDWPIYLCEFGVFFCFIFQLVLLLIALKRMIRLKASSDSTRTSNTKLIIAHVMCEFLLMSNEIALTCMYMTHEKVYTTWMVLSYVLVFSSFIT